MMLLISAGLALLPLLAIVWIVFFGAVTTVDGLFTSLILLAISGVFALNTFIELRKGSSGSSQSFGDSRRKLVNAGGSVQKGRVESVQFFEAHVGQPNKSIVVISDGAKNTNMLAVEGDVRNALPVGRKVEITLRNEGGKNVLVNVNYA
ncbi:MAG TPA: hypothetical protein VH437_07155 [Terriglobales bacterium]